MFQEPETIEKLCEVLSGDLASENYSVGMHLAEISAMYQHDDATFMQNLTHAAEDAPRHYLERGLPIEAALREIVNMTAVAVTRRMALRMKGADQSGSA